MEDEIVKEIRLRMSLEGQATGASMFEVLAMTAGEGNGWLFEAGVLRESLPLWNRVECFIDHSLSERSIRDLAGVFDGAEWDEISCGIRVKL